LSISQEIEQEGYITAYGGVSTLRYSLLDGQRRGGGGGGVGAAYHPYFSKKWSVSFGINYNWLNASVKANSLAGHYESHTGFFSGSDEPFDFRYAIVNYKEKQKVGMLTIPLMGYYHFGKEQQWYGGFGFTAGIPLRSSYKASADHVNTTGYIPLLNLTIDRPFPRAGFGDYPASIAEDNIPLKTAFLFSAEAGHRWRSDDGWAIYAGLYIDCGVNDISNGGKQPYLVPYYATGVPEGESYRLKSVLTATNDKGKTYAEKIRPLETGVRVKVAFGNARRNKFLEPKHREKAFGIARKNKFLKPKHDELDLIEAVLRDPESTGIVPENLSKLMLTRIAGTVYDEKGKPMYASVELTEKTTQAKVADVNSNSQDGSYLMEVPPGKNYDLTVMAGGKMLHSEKVDLSRDSKPRVVSRDVRMQDIKAGAKTVLQNIEFEYAKYEFASSSIPELMRVVRWLNANPSVRIEISGHTDNVSSLATNMPLSENRAKAIYDFLVQNGIPTERLQYKGYGPNKPVATNSTEEGRAKNRRVEMTVTDM
jgi:outer membrane protein OmpA-like peptidoglycan-associated protein